MNGNNQNNNQERKKYTDISINTVLWTDGEKEGKYNRITLPKVLVSRDRFSEPRKVSSGDLVCDISIPIENQAKYISDNCGLKPFENDKGTSWAKLTLWNKQAENLLTFLDKHPNCILTIEGSIVVNESASEDGRTFVNTNIKVMKWTFQRDVRSAGNSNFDANKSGSSNSGYSNYPSAPQEDYSGFSDLSDIEDEEELPF